MMESGLLMLVLRLMKTQLEQTGANHTNPPTRTLRTKATAITKPRSSQRSMRLSTVTLSKGTAR